MNIERLIRKMNEEGISCNKLKVLYDDFREQKIALDESIRSLNVPNIQNLIEAIRCTKERIADYLDVLADIGYLNDFELQTIVSSFMEAY